MTRRNGQASSSAAPRSGLASSTMAQVVASGPVEIADPQRPLGERVFTLTGADDAAGVLRWQASGVGKDGEKGEDNSAALRRVTADPAVREAIRKRLKFGMTVVMTDAPATAATRSREGFVVLGSET